MTERDVVLDIAIGLVFREGRVLICQRKAEAHLGSLWEFPGGKVEAGESIEAAVERELAEEVGLVVKVGELFHKEVAKYPERTVRLHFFTCASVSQAGEAKPLAASQLAWVELSRLGDFAFPSGNRTVLEKLKAVGQPKI